MNSIWSWLFAGWLLFQFIDVKSLVKECDCDCSWTDREEFNTEEETEEETLIWRG